MHNSLKLLNEINYTILIFNLNNLLYLRKILNLLQKHNFEIMIKTLKLVVSFSRFDKSNIYKQ